jgi:hypothetical protein
VPLSLAFEIASVVFAALLAFTIPELVNARLAPIVKLWKRIASNPKRCLWIAFFAPILVRLATLPIYPLPEPFIHDEFSHLLVADTLVHGRLANPPHPLWRHFETMHVMFNPAYASKYPVGQGAALAIPQLIGLPPYWGIWISLGLMTAAVCWMLQAWFSNAWSLVAVVMMPRITLFGYWAHSFWGGAVPAIGGALALGALARMMKKPRASHGWMMGIGIFIAGNSRPYEGAVLTLVLGITFLIWVFRGGAFKTVLVPLSVMAMIAISFTALHNYRVTGDPTKLPYQHNRELYGTPQSFYWQNPVPLVPSEHAPIVLNQRWQLQMHEAGQSLSDLARITRGRLFDLWLFFAAPLWTPALFFVPWFSSRYRLPLAALLMVLVATLLYPFSFSHYYGPVAGVFFLILIAGLENLRRLKLSGKPVGAAFSSILMLACPATYLLFVSYDIMGAQGVRQPHKPRTQAISALEKMGGSHVIFVRYRPDHDFNNEYVYNAADIDASNIVWARDMGSLENLEVMRYYQGRRFWLFEPDMRPPRLTPYQTSSAPPQAP